MFCQKLQIIFTIIILLYYIPISESQPSKASIKSIYGVGLRYEEPYWADDEQALYWTDTEGRTILRLDTRTGKVTTRVIGYGLVSLIVRVKNYPKLILVSVRAELYLLAWDSPKNDRSLRLLTAVDIGKPDNRFSDGKVDAKGRLWAGTVGKISKEDVITKDKASLYLICQSNYKHPEIKVRPVTISNGIAWTSDNKHMYYTDSVTKKIDVFDFDLKTGYIKNRTTFFDFEVNNVTGIPDGMTIDTDNNLWVACYRGSKVIKIDTKTGKLLEQYEIPVSHVTSVMWGGRNLSTLYVTTSKLYLTAAQLAQEPEAGSLFTIEGTGAKGYPQNQFVFANADKY